MEIRMEIYASIDGQDLRGVFRVWILERKLFRTFKFKLYNYLQDSRHFEVSHNEQQFMSLQVSNSADDEVANQQAAALTPGRDELMFLMGTLLNQSLKVLLADPAVGEAKEQGLRTMHSTMAICKYQTPQECERYEAVSSELFVLPDSMVPETESPPVTTH